MEKLDKSTLHAKVTIEFLFQNVCQASDLKDTKMSFKEMVTYLIGQEGICGLIDEEDGYKITKIERAK